MAFAPPAPPRPELEELLRRVKGYVMTPAERDAQARSWVRGNVGLSRPDLTTEEMDKAIDAAIGPSPYARIAELERALVEIRRVVVVACGDSAPYIKVALANLDAALAATMSGVPSGSREPVNGNGDGT